MKKIKMIKFKKAMPRPLLETEAHHGKYIHWGTKFKRLMGSKNLGFCGCEN